ncbi:hypothetical protein SO694_00049051 [Aureococcus anophagefferens]|uniref:Uncharacterized protein n=1 Tax=Aureococcus anophagefferens TaxID=44056 RepID=A0ABR1G7Z2_AURAN
MGLLPRCALLAVAAAAADVADIADFRNYAAGKLKAGLAQKKLAAAFDGSEAARMRRPKRMLDTIHPYIREAWDTKGAPVLSAATGGTNTFFLDGDYAHEADDHEGREHGEDDPPRRGRRRALMAASMAAMECMASNCPTFDDFDYYSYSYDSDDNYFDGTCASVSDIVEFAYQCTMGDDSCSACADLIRTYVEDIYEYILTGIGLDCDLSCPAVGVTNVVTGDLTVEGMTLADAEANEAVFIGAIADSVGVQDEYVTVTISAASRRRRLTDTLTAEAADQGVSSEFASVQTTAASTPTASTEGEALDGASAASAFGVVLSAAVGLAALA